MKRDLTSAPGTEVYPHNHPCKSLEYGKLIFHLAVSHHAGTVDSGVDRNEHDNKSETYQVYREKMILNTTEDLERIRGP
jgi:hypothetical protein